MKKLIVLVLLLGGCSYSPNIVRDSYNSKTYTYAPTTTYSPTYAPTHNPTTTYSPTETTTNHYQPPPPPPSPPPSSTYSPRQMRIRIIPSYGRSSYERPRYERSYHRTYRRRR